MLYLDHDNSWVRKRLVREAIGSPVVNGKPDVGPNGPKNGILGDARASTQALGRRLFEIKVNHAVTQIREFEAMHSR
jgi:creatinine amidohydrolase/Fe(II)-dependent formamide hydrolase-like protein